MSDLSNVIANLTPEKKAALIARLKSGNQNRIKKPEIDFEGNFEYQFQSETPFDYKVVQTEVGDPGPDFVQVEAKASSLNFRDVMIASRMYPASPGVPSNMGSDYAGTVVKVGSNVKDVKVGDEVIVLNIGHVNEQGVVRENCHFIKTFNVYKYCVCPKPKALSFEAASCIPTVYLTSYIALIELAKIQKGERVLIHMASGGVGLSAVQLAQWSDATIFATAGTPEKREYLRSIGIQQIFDSRSNEFVEGILSQGQEMEVVLNTLSGGLMLQSMCLMAPFGRFIHIDKKDIAGNTPLPMQFFSHGLSFQFLDVSLLFKKPALIRERLKCVVSLFDEYEFQPIHHQVFNIRDLKKAVTTMSRGTHIGKIVVSYDPNKTVYASNN
ncbi:MAG: zinc-binding dehydrogenase [Saprospiraceae bacterium]|nr:zinc-binding dehydrogenase [Saprospiraceae bacterium]